MKYRIRSGFEGDVLTPWMARLRPARFKSVEIAGERACDELRKYLFGVSRSRSRTLVIEVYSRSEGVRMRFTYDPHKVYDMSQVWRLGVATMTSADSRLSYHYTLEINVPAKH